nr:hypothetical protein [Tanacetum cinerariifolium]
MATTIEQQVALDEALVPSAQRLRIGRSNFRLPSDIQSKEPTLQVVYDVLHRSPFFRAFLVTADVPEIYMQEFWATATVHQHSIRFKMGTRKHIVDLESFREMLHISPRVPGQSFAELPFEEEILEFLRFLGHSAQIKTLTDVNVNKLYQPWRSFAAVINKCLTGKSTGFDGLRLSQAQILWGLYHRRNVDYAFLIWEDLVYPSGTQKSKEKQRDVYKEYYACATGEAAPKPKASAKKKKGGSASSTTPLTPIATPTPTTTVMAAPRLSAAAKGKQPARARSPTEPSDVEWTEAEQLKIVLRRSRHEMHISQQGGSGTDEGTSSKPGVLDVTSDDSEEELSWNSSDDEDAAPKPKASARRKKGGYASSTTPPTPIATPTPTTTVVAALRLSAAAKGKQPARATSPTDPSDVERTEAEQLKIVLRRSRHETHISQQRGSSTDEGTGSKPGVSDVPSDDSKEEISWNSSDDEDVDDQTKGSDDKEGEETDESDDDQEETEKVNDDDDDEEEISKIGEQEATESDEGDDEATESDGESEDEETREQEKESFDPIPQTPEDSEDDDNNEKNQGLRIGEEERIREEEEADELYRDVDINQGRGLQVSQETEDSHVILTPTHFDGQQESSSTSSFVTNLLNPIIHPASQPPIPSIDLQNLPTFASVFHFEDRVKSLEVNFSNIPSIVQQYMHQQMLEAVREAVQIQTDRLQDSIQRENDEFLKTIDDNMKKIIKAQVKSQVKAQVTRILPRIKESVNTQREAEVLTRSSHSSRTSYAVAADLSEMELKKILIEKMEGNKSIQLSDEQRNLYKALVEAFDADKTILDAYGESAILKRRREDDDQKGPSAGSDRGSKRRRERREHESVSTLSEPATGSAGRSTTGTQSRHLFASESAFAEEPVQTTCQMEEPSHSVFETGNAQSWISALAKQTDARFSFNELLDTPTDFSNFIMNRLGVDTLTPDLLAGPTYELMRGSCNSLTELKYHLEEVYKATTDQLDWVNPEGQQYPHNLLQPLPLIPDNRGHRVIPFEHFINNYLEYLRGGASSRKYTTSVTKTKAADYGHIKWIEDLVPRTMWIHEPINYDKHALWGVSHWGRKRQQFYGFAVNRESTLDVYSKRRIIAVTDLKIVEWHNYKHLDWISVRRDDDKIYKFKEDDFKRLRLQDIEDMLLLLVQGKLSNLTVKERFAFNVSLRMFTRSIVIQRRVEDLQLGVKSYQKRLNLTKPNTYRSDLKRREAYTAYSNQIGFIYQNKDKKNRLMRIDELHKFSDGTLNDVRNALDDRLKGIRMQYFPTTIWIKGDKDRATAMIQAIDKMLKTRRIMRSLGRMFTRSIVIQRRAKDLQLGVESYQKRLNLTKPDTYRSDLKRREAYTAYLNPKGFIYQNRDKKNRLMRIDELHKFSDGTLNDVRNALDDRLKGIRMQYFLTTIWRKGDKDRAAAMIQAIDKMLKTRRIMRSLERFVGGRQYEGDF